MQITKNPPFPLSLAPMVGLSHAVLRQVVKEYMPQDSESIWPTEMLNSRRIPDEVIGRNSETLVLPNESRICPQLLGNEKRAIQRSIERLDELWPLHGIDINMGCPVQKALRHNYGVALMGDFDYARSVVEMASEVTSKKNLQLSVKLRAVNSNKSNLELRQLVHGLVDAGATRITLHPRTAEQQRRGRADWQQIKVLVDEFKSSSIQIIGNGDIQTVEDVFRMMSETGVTEVMSGRALTARPWLMWQVGERLGFQPPLFRKGEKAPVTAHQEGAEYGRMLARYVDLIDEIFCRQISMNENLALRRIQFFVKTSHVWLEFGHALMSTVTAAKTLSECRDRIRRFFESEQRMHQMTELRQ
jgi:tRNA-dihydrouridine synthase B